MLAVASCERPQFTSAPEVVQSQEPRGEGKREIDADDELCVAPRELAQLGGHTLACVPTLDAHELAVAGFGQPQLAADAGESAGPIDRDHAHGYGLDRALAGRFACLPDAVSCFIEPHRLLEAERYRRDGRLARGSPACRFDGG